MWWKDLPDETLMESTWERQMQFTGIERFEQARIKSNGKVEEAHETRSGHKFLRKHIDRAAEAIEDMQRKVIGVNRVDRNLRGTVLLVPAETAALLTLRVLLDQTYRTVEVEYGANYQVVCKEIAKAIELELNFRHWIKTSREAAEAFAKTKGISKVPRSMAERLIEEEGLTHRSMRRWRRTFDELNTYHWESLEQHYCGEAMAKTTIDALPEVFEIKKVWKQGKEVRHVRMKDEFRVSFNEAEAKIASLQVVKKPMLTRPRPWRIE